ncbi:MAG: hypothetical protein BWY72_00871 [Bacteroidetes bacterium ADurb.Bin416]|nr:MAG: hypothetical protein BWY72_00871 [Bacteroidetes bacterium ADurb.Bin416]
MTNRTSFRPSSKRSMVLERRDSGAMYNKLAEPLLTRSMALARSMGSSKPLMVTASVMPAFSRLSTWSFISDCRGDMTTVNPRTFSPLIKAGSWKVRDLPPPVGKMARRERLSTAAWAAFSCRGSPP